MSLPRRFSTACVVLVASGCGIDVRPFPPGQGQDPAAGGAPYPPGPYALTAGSVIANYKLQGYAVPSNGDRSALVDVQLSDFYNPTGEGLFPADSAYGERPKPKVLLINVSAVWCAPCQYENKEVLPRLHAEYAPQGGEFLLVLADGPTVGDPAEKKHLDAWVGAYKTAWPATIDPTYKFSGQFKGSAFPVNIIVDTETMQIEEILAGAPADDGAFFEAFEALLSG